MSMRRIFQAGAFLLLLLGRAFAASNQDIEVDFHFSQWESSGNEPKEMIYSVELKITNLMRGTISIPSASLNPLNSWNEKEGQLRIYFGAEIGKLRKGQLNVPSRWQFMPVELHAGESTIIRHKFRDPSLKGREIKIEVNYSVDQALAERFGFWHGNVSAKKSESGF